MLVIVRFGVSADANHKQEIGRFSRSEINLMWRLARIVLLATTASAVSISAFAADLPARMEPVAPVAYVPAFSWTGFYLGGELGWIQTNPKYTTGALLLGAPFLVTSGSDKNGLTYGVLAGYNYQVGQLVLGVEGDFAGLDGGPNTLHRNHRRFPHGA